MNTTDVSSTLRTLCPREHTGTLALLHKCFFPAQTANVSMSQLPVELVSLILESAYYDQNLEPDYQCLSSCALVCRNWSTPSQALLFRHVFLRSSSAFTAFRSAVDPTTARGQNLRSNVAQLRIIIDHNHPDQLSHRALAVGLLSCPNLYELDLSIYGCSIPSPNNTSGIRVFRAAPSFDPDTLDLLRAGPSIQSIKFSNWSDNDQLAFQLLSDVWPKLTAVSLRGTPPRLPAFDDRPILPFGCALSELRCNFQTTLCSDFVNWLLSDSTRSLRSLELEHMPEVDVFAPLLLRYGPSLESLALPSCTLRNQASLVRGCERLKEFRFETANISLLFEQVPTSVEHIAFSISRGTQLYLMVKFIKARRNLKAITAHVWDDAISHPQMPSLRIACACNGVELLVVRGIRRFREVVRGDPLPCSSYPRRKEPANFRRMVCIARHARGGGGELEASGSSQVTRRQRPRAESAAAMLSRPVLSELADANNITTAPDGHSKKL